VRWEKKAENYLRLCSLRVPNSSSSYSFLDKVLKATITNISRNSGLSSS
jgi:hypothetical protein